MGSSVAERPVRSGDDRVRWGACGVRFSGASVGDAGRVGVDRGPRAGCHDRLGEPQRRLAAVLRPARRGRWGCHGRGGEAVRFRAAGAIAVGSVVLICLAVSRGPVAYCARTLARRPGDRALARLTDPGRRRGRRADRRRGRAGSGSAIRSTRSRPPTSRPISTGSAAIAVGCARWPACGSSWRTAEPRRRG